MLTIVTPTLNAAEFIKENIDSINELEIDVEHIFVDGGSTDGTLEIIERSLGDNSKLVYQRDDNGMYSALQLGFEQAKGQWFAYVNADDKVIKEGFERMYEIAHTGKYDLVYSDGHYYWSEKDELEKLKGKRFGKYHLRNGFMPFLQPSTIFSRDIFEKIGGFRYNKFNIAGDLDLFQRMALQGDFRAKYIPVSSSIFLKYGNSLGDNNTDIYYQEMKLLARQNRNIFNKALFKISGII